MSWYKAKKTHFTVAVGFATREEKVLTEDELAARDDARRTFAALAFFGDA